MATIDLTPTWEQILPTLLMLLENGNAEGRKTARTELARMARIADEHVAQSKAAFTAANEG